MSRNFILKYFIRKRNCEHLEERKSLCNCNLHEVLDFKKRKQFWKSLSSFFFIKNHGKSSETLQNDIVTAKCKAKSFFFSIIYRGKLRKTLLLAIKKKHKHPQKMLICFAHFEEKCFQIIRLHRFSVTNETSQ